VKRHVGGELLVPIATFGFGDGAAMLVTTTGEPGVVSREVAPAWTAEAEACDVKAAMELVGTAAGGGELSTVLG